MSFANDIIGLIEGAANAFSGLIGWMIGKTLPITFGYAFILLFVATLVYFGIKWIELILRYVLYIAWAILILALIAFAIGG